jgi:hypothetical protein
MTGTGTIGTTRIMFITLHGGTQTIIGILGTARTTDIITPVTIITIGENTNTEQTIMLPGMTAAEEDRAEGSPIPAAELAMTSVDLQQVLGTMAYQEQELTVKNLPKETATLDLEAELRLEVKTQEEPEIQRENLLQKTEVKDPIPVE